MKKYFKTVIFAGVLAAFGGAFSETKIMISREPSAKEVVAFGEGEDEATAIRAASQRAIEQAYGFNLDAYQQVEGGEMVKDRVTTKTNASIASYEIVRKLVLPSGRVRVLIKARVRKNKPVPKKPVDERVICPECEGRRYVKIEIVCTKCHGRGIMPIKVKAGIGGRNYRTGGGECPICRGVGKVSRTGNCSYCNGTGKVGKEKAAKSK